MLKYDIGYDTYVTWDKESVLRATDRLEKEGTLWVLVLCDRRSIGTGMTSNKHKWIGTIRAYGKNQGIGEPSQPDIEQVYKNINRKQIVDKDGNYGYVNLEDKPNILRLTTLGKGLLKTIQNNGKIKQEVMRSIGIETDELPNPWWPGQDHDDDAEVQLQTTSKRPPDDVTEYDIDVVARFTCFRCGVEIEHTYLLTLVDGCPIHAWSRTVEAACENCEQKYEHFCGDPFNQPSAVN